MKLGHTLKAGIAVAVVLAGASAAHAAAITYFGNNPTANGGVVDAGPGLDPVNQRNLFRNSLTSSRVENFEGRTATTNPLGGDTTVNDVFGAASGVTLTATNPNGTNQDRTAIQQNTYGGTPGAPGAGFLGRFSTTGDPSSATTLNNGSNFTGGKWWETNFTTVTIQFTTAVDAFGTFMTDLGDFNGGLSVELFSGNTSVERIQLLSPSGGSVNGGLAFFGYTNDTSSFNRVVFSIAQGTTNPSNFDTVGFDDFITGTLRGPIGTISEPTSLALVGLSLALLGSVNRRRSRA